MKTTSLAALALATQITLEITSAPRAAGLWWPWSERGAAARRRWSAWRWSHWRRKGVASTSSVTPVAVLGRAAAGRALFAQLGSHFSQQSQSGEKATQW